MKCKWLRATWIANGILFVALLLSVTFVPAAFATWSVHEPSVTGASTVAHAENSAGQRIDVFVEESGTVVLRLQLGSGYETFRRANCPTFQIDAREPLHH